MNHMIYFFSNNIIHIFPIYEAPRPFDLGPMSRQRYVFGIAAVDLIGQADYSTAETVRFRTHVVVAAPGDMLNECVFC